MVRIIADAQLADEVLRHGHLLATQRRTSQMGAAALSLEDASYTFAVGDKEVTVQRTLASLESGKPYDRIEVASKDGSTLAVGAGVTLENPAKDPLDYEFVSSDPLGNPDASNYLAHGQIALNGTELGGSAAIDGSFAAMMAAADFLNTKLK